MEEYQLNNTASSDNAASVPLMHLVSIILTKKDIKIHRGSGNIANFYFYLFTGKTPYTEHLLSNTNAHKRYIARRYD